MEDYIILGGTEFLRMHASSVAKVLDLIVGNVNDRGLLSTLPVIDILVQVPNLNFPESNCSLYLIFELETALYFVIFYDSKFIIYIYVILRREREAVC